MGPEVAVQPDGNNGVAVYSLVVGGGGWGEWGVVAGRGALMGF